MPANYVLLEKITVGAAGASSVTFSGIPQTGYTDLVIKSSARCTVDGDAFKLQFNGVTASSNYSSRMLVGNGSTATSNTPGQTNFILPGYSTTVTANTFGNQEIYIPNYTSTTAKSVSVDNVQEANQSSPVYSNLVAGLYSTSTSGITSIAIGFDSGTIVANSTFYLYGVAKLGTTPAIVPYATGGDTIMTDGTYWYHTFISSGTFTPQKGLSCDYLVVAGGGGGGYSAGGGGGAGGFLTSIGGSPLSLGTSAVTVTVGAGGAASSAGNGGNGSNSVFSSITSTGGGGGGAGSAAGLAGGSGGGGGFGLAGGTATASPVQGNNGGTGNIGNPPYSGAGGGGATAVGANGTAVTGGAGGAGTASSISGSSVTYSGGGGGGSTVSAGAGGTGGGGAGNGTAGTVNLGGGGGGNAASSNGAAGGAGIVIVRYAV